MGGPRRHPAAALHRDADRIRPQGLRLLAAAHPHDLTGFLRWESSADAGESIYLKLFPMFVRQRNVLGLRWDFVSHQALTLQLSDTNTLDGHFSDIRLQWSAAFL